MKRKINIVETGPRDGFQNIKEYIPMAIKFKIIEGLISSGIKSIQITSFVSPKAIPQLKDAKELTNLCLEKYSNLDLFALVPNLTGAKLAADTGLKKISNVISLSKSHNKANINSTHEQSFDNIKNILQALPQIDFCADIATAFGCPFEGKPVVQSLIDFVGKIGTFGVREFNICDTIGVANPLQVRDTVNALIKHFPNYKFQIHIHDTRNMGMLNTFCAIECGIDNVQTTLGGLGGCPFAPGASGNTATEDLVYMLEDMGCYQTGVDFSKLLPLAQYQKTIIDGNFSGHHMFIGSCQ